MQHRPRARSSSRRARVRGCRAPGPPPSPEPRRRFAPQSSRPPADRCPRGPHRCGSVGRRAVVRGRAGQAARRGQVPAVRGGPPAGPSTRSWRSSLRPGHGRRRAAGRPAVARVVVVTDDPAAPRRCGGRRGRGRRTSRTPGSTRRSAHGGRLGARRAGPGRRGGAAVGRPAGAAAGRARARRCGPAGRASAGVRRPTRDGTGTTLLATAARRARPDPRYGAGSAAAHRATGAVALSGDWPVAAARRRHRGRPAGRGRARPRPGHGGLDRHPRRRLSRGPVPAGRCGVQATVATFDPGPGPGPC